jgi:aspartyl-tRNA(Asn)/glutamyl-tRNA(Gln) amidotransferase subunit C
MFSKEEVKHIAKLARLGLSEKEITKFQKELSSILDYVEKLKEADVSKTEATSHAVKVENVVRKDEGRKSGIEKKLVELSPDKKDGFIKVKSVLK